MTVLLTLEILMKRKEKMTKMGRPRRDSKVLRVGRGVRLDPNLLKRVDLAIKEDRIIGAHNWTTAVEIALNMLLRQAGG
jgi:hypothetical protein